MNLCKNKLTLGTYINCIKINLDVKINVQTNLRKEQRYDFILKFDYKTTY